MSKIERYTKEINGILYTAVLYSPGPGYGPGYGGGWSTFARQEMVEFMTMDKGLVNLALSNAPERSVIVYIEEQGHKAPYTGGWPEIEIYWLPVGTKFLIDECDGSESVRIPADLWLTT